VGISNLLSLSASIQWTSSVQGGIDREDKQLEGFCLNFFWNIQGAQSYTLNIEYSPVWESSRKGPIPLSPVENLWIFLLIFFSEFY
jgi:hypothetical protein